jgi:integrase
LDRPQQCFRWGVENELVPPSILHGLQAISPLKRGRVAVPEGKPVEAVPEEHVTPVLEFVSRQVATMIQLQQLTGMRPGEVVLIRPCDIDRTSTVWVYRPSRHKTEYKGHERRVFLGPKAQVLLHPFLDRHSESFCFSPSEAEAERHTRRRENRKTPIYASPSAESTKPVKGRRPPRECYDRDSYRRAIEYGIRKAGTPHWHPHQLRHACGTLVRSRFGLDAAQVILGHRSASVTEIYAEADAHKAADIIQRIG